MTKRDEMDTQTLEDAAKAAFKQAQNVYRLNYDHFPLKNTWESVDESIRDGWRKIVSAALRVGAPPLDEYEVAEALAPYFEEGFTPRDGARAVMMLIGKRLSAQAEPGYVVDRNEALKSIYDKLAEEEGGTWATYMMMDIESAIAALPAPQAGLEPRGCPTPGACSCLPADAKPVAWLQSQNGVEIVSKHRLGPAAFEYGWTEKPLYTTFPSQSAKLRKALEKARNILKGPHHQGGAALIAISDSYHVIDEALSGAGDGKESEGGCMADFSPNDPANLQELMSAAARSTGRIGE